MALAKLHPTLTQRILTVAVLHVDELDPLCPTRSSYDIEIRVLWPEDTPEEHNTREILGAAVAVVELCRVLC